MIEGHERTIRAAQGYSELSMFDDALAELDSLPPETAGHEEVVELRATILMRAKRWAPALAASRAFCALQPARAGGYLQAAFCLHAMGRTSEARAVLLRGPVALHAEPGYHYNLACYECVLGNLKLARMHLEKSIELDKKYRNYAKGDPDLAALHP